MKSWGEYIPVRRRFRGPSNKIIIAAVFIAVLVWLPHWVVFTYRGNHAFMTVFKWVTSIGKKEHIRYMPKYVDFEWDSIEATEDFQFHPCFNGFQCAKLKLPLDYFNGTYPNSTISLALTKLPARVAIDDPRYGGPVLINPGGPGGSGVKQALRSAYLLQTFVDAYDPVEPDTPVGPYEFYEPYEYDSSNRFFDIIGFDPRGIGETKPGSTCIVDGASRWAWRLREDSEGILGSSDAVLGRMWAMSHAYGTACKQSADDMDEPDIKQYMTTASVARDMLEVVERHSEHVAAKVPQKRWLSRPPKHDKTTTKLQYFGFSYGTYLGYTFASMFPDRVGRMILDGVVNSDDYNLSLGNGSLHDAEKAMTSFYTWCINVGSLECPLSRFHSTIEGLKTRIQDILGFVYHKPLAIQSVNGPEVITYSDVKNSLFYALYSPEMAFPLISQLLSALQDGYGQILKDWAKSMREGHVYSCPLNQAVADPLDAEWAILCSDGEDVSRQKIDQFKKYWHVLNNTSPTSGSIWAMLRMRCNSWQIRPVHRYTGNFGTNTSHPVLFISNTADPVTPLRSGRIMHARFPGSGHLVQDSAGHCSLSTPTICTILHIKKYFQTGRLPELGTVCVPEPSPFSLNSTVPGSPFYDPSLSQKEAIEDRRLGSFLINRRGNRAIPLIQQWFAQENSFWPTRGAKRAKGLLALDSKDYWGSS